MTFRFEQLQLLPNCEYDYDNKKFLGVYECNDYVQYVELLNWMKENDKDVRLVQERFNYTINDFETVLDDEVFRIVNIDLRISLDDNNTGNVCVYVTSEF
jgi:hypothetical protein